MPLHGALCLALNLVNLPQQPHRPPNLQLRPPHAPAHRRTPHKILARSTPQGDDAQYNLRRQTFDPLENARFRRETILQYTLINRSEQLRILFFSSSAVLAALTPLIAGELFPAANAAAADSLPPTLQWVLSLLTAAFFGSAALQQKALRGSKLRRLEKEFQLADLEVRQLTASLGSAGVVQLSSLRGRRRVVVVYGDSAELRQAARQAATYRRRLVQSGVVLVAALRGDGEWPDEVLAGERAGWLWRPVDDAEWAGYLDGLLASRAVETAAWLALSFKGRSCGSGVGLPPWDELFGTRLPPLKPPRADARAVVGSAAAEQAVLDTQERLYASLSRTDARAVEALCTVEEDAEVSELRALGRLDAWDVVLADGVTSGIRLADADARVDGRVAYTTGIEHPASGLGTLLCTQKWVDVSEPKGAPPEWKLAQHRTIPYVDGLDASACLRCDCRGCVALQRLAQG